MIELQPLTTSLFFISQPLPTDWWSGSNTFSSLRHLHLNNNRFNGTIPEAFTTMGNGRLEQLLIHDNDFDGTFPGGWNPSNFLSILEIQNTNFEAIPQYVCNMIVFTAGEMTTLRADCSICNCGTLLCDPPRCIE
jgi:hypothetical protein